MYFADAPKGQGLYLHRRNDEDPIKDIHEEPLVFVKLTGNAAMGGKDNLYITDESRLPRYYVGLDRLPTGAWFSTADN